MKVTMQCEVCGSESTFRMSGESMMCNTCNSPIAVGKPAEIKWKAYQEAIKKVKEEVEQSTARRQADNDIEDLAREAERMEKNMPYEEERQTYADAAKSMRDYDEEHEAEYEAEEVRSHFVDEPDDALVSELVKLTQNTIVVLGLTKRILEEKGLISSLPALPKGYEDIKKKFDRLKIDLGYID